MQHLFHSSARYSAALAVATSLLLSACGTAPKQSPGPLARNDTSANKQTNTNERSLPVLPPANSGRGAYYQDDGPGDSPPPGLYEVPDAEPKIETLAKTGNKPYVVFGKTYKPLTDDRPYVQRGIGSWYGRKFHGQRTSSGETYDMYKMTAAHPLLPIPSFARVTNLINGKQVIVRVNDRGPFHAGRAIDLSYTAALKLGLLGKGSHEVEIERLLPDEIVRINAKKMSDPAPARPAPLLALSERDAKQIRDLDKDLRSAPILSAPAAKPDASAADNTSLSMAAAETELNVMHLEQTLTASANASTNTNAAPNKTNAGFYLQLGAFSQVDNAEAERAKLIQKQLPSVEVVQSGNLYRLYSGPFASRAEAQQAAVLAQNNKAVVVQR